MFVLPSRIRTPGRLPGLLSHRVNLLILLSLSLVALLLYFLPSLALGGVLGYLSYMALTMLRLAFFSPVSPM